MNATLKVTPAKLRSTASAFQSTGNQIKSITNQMTSIVRSLSGQVFSGDAASKYVSKFNSLSDDIQRMINMINEHVNDLNQIAKTFEDAERQNISAAEALTSDVIK